jgi:protease I
MAGELDGKKVAFLFADGVEQAELEEPLKALREAGAETTLVSLETGEVQMFEHIDHGDTITADLAVSDANPSDYDLLVLPGGVANPDFLRADEDAVSFARSFVDGDKWVAAICHAPWTLVEADVVRGRTLTSWPTLKTDLTNAGATWVDEEVHVDGKLITSRKPDDIPAFSAKIIELVGAS